MPEHTPRALVDIAIVVVVYFLTIAQLSHEGAGAFHAGTRGLDRLGGLVALGSVVPLLGWRRAPGAVFWLTAIFSVVLAAAGYGLTLPVGVAVALYLLVAGREDADAWTGRRVTGIVLAFAAYVAAAAIGSDGFPGGQILHAGLAWAIAWFAGERTRLLHAHLVGLRERAERGDRDAEHDRRLAAAEERARIARDLHDSVGHAINVITVRAGVARLRHADNPDRSLVALTEIEEVARSTAQDMDQIVATLRDRPDPLDEPVAPVGLASLATLIEHHASGGLAVESHTSGSPQPLAHAVDQAAYRIAQEALTNAARHGAGRVELELAYTGDALSLTVINPVAAGRPTFTSSGGQGLTGMRERAALIGGAVQVQRVNGTFHVCAQLPYGAQPP